MKRFFVKDSLDGRNEIRITGMEHNHIRNVLRLREGEEIILVCGDDYDYTAEILQINKIDTLVCINSKVKNISNPRKSLNVYQAIVKSDNMNLIIQKLTELGVDTFTPFESKFITSKDKSGKVDKWQEISYQSIKQCKRSRPMIVRDTLKFDKMLDDLTDYDMIIFANECEKSVSLKDINFTNAQKVALIIGSEGGFSKDEIEKITTKNALSVTLGNRILRAETASISLSSVAMFLLGEWE